MGKRVDVDELVDTTDIALRLGVKRLQVVHDWRRRHADFPAPIRFFGRQPIWYWPEVERWARQTGRLGGR